MTTGEILTLIGLVMGLPGGFWIIYSTLDGKIEAKIEGLRRRAHETGGEMQKQFISIDDDILDLTSRLSRLEGRINGKAL